MGVVISGVKRRSPAEKKKIAPGDTLLSIGGKEIADVLDYRFHMTGSKLVLLIRRGDGSLREVHIRKPEYEDLGLEFDTYLMDKQQRCKNSCIFCFVDQLPPGMRESLYFKDDDSRMSFLFGNYITLTNITQREVDRICEMHISPMNISVHTTNPELRVRMMKNKHAGESLKYLARFAEAGIKLNCQLVLCPGINDGEELVRSLRDLTALYPAVTSIAAVPVGLTKYREGLYPLTCYGKNSAAAVLEITERFAAECLEHFGTRICYASDEFYIKAGKELPGAAYYEEFAQLENGVGMFPLLREDFLEALNEEAPPSRARKLTLATGMAIRPFLASLVDNLTEKWHNFECTVTGIKNEFFGGAVDVSGLLTARDIISQLRGHDFGQELLLPASIMRQQGDVTLDGCTAEYISSELGVPVNLVKDDGYELLLALKGRE
ncbi:MAG TPA: radical SAM protein [Ruminococcaceae bacterium]|nr:radical SAM protein [Oscillospiraceae bacterium]